MGIRTQELLLLGLIAWVGLAPARELDVRDYGAKGDGIVKDTAAIQRAINAAATQGGGTVALGAGTYLSGSIFLKSNVELRLCAGAVIKGSPDPSDYNAADVCPQNAASSRSGDNTSGGHLILCVGQHNVTVRGPGRIDGNSDAFILDEKGRQYPSKSAIRWRPSQMVWFVDSTDVRIEDVELANSPYWTCFLLNCTRVWIRGCYVHTERRRYHTFNGDGIDIDRCRHVAVSDCRIDTADDCLTLRASCAERLAKPQDCAFVTVDNCSLSSSCNVIRPGVGEGRIHDCTLSNLVISDSSVAFNFVAAYSPKSRGPDITDIRISNVRIADARQFVKIHHMFSKEAVFRGLVFSGVSGTVKRPSQVFAHPNRPFEGIRFENCDIPCGVQVVNAKDVRFTGGTLREEPLSDERRTELSEAIENHKILLY